MATDDPCIDRIDDRPTDLDPPSMAPFLVLIGLVYAVLSGFFRNTGRNDPQVLSVTSAVTVAIVGVIGAVAASNELKKTRFRGVAAAKGWGSVSLGGIGTAISVYHTL